MKAELRIAHHAILPEEDVVEVWYAGKFIATVTGWDGPGVRIISRHMLTAQIDDHLRGASLSVSGHHPNAVTVAVSES